MAQGKRRSGRRRRLEYGLQRQRLMELLFKFKTAYENIGLAAFQELPAANGARIWNLEKLFDDYTRITTSIDGSSLLNIDTGTARSCRLLSSLASMQTTICLPPS